MAQGFCPALLRSIEQVAGSNAPSLKLNIAGFLAMTFCCQNSSVSPLNDAYGSDGTQRTLTVSYRRRPLITDVQDEDDCDINRIPSKNEWNLPATSHKQHSFWLSDDQVQHYCSDALAQRSVGTPSTRIMQEVYGLFLESANVLLGAINKDLVTSATTQFGYNSITGSAAARTLNFPSSTTTLDLSAGMIQMLRDWQENEICGDPCIVGGGLFASYNLAQQIACCNAAGVDTSRFGMPKFFFDKNATTVWGTNQVGVFAPGSVKFINRQKYVGAFAGQRGTSTFFTIALPVNEFGCAQDCLSDLVFDVQMKYIDCPTSVTVNGSATTVNRGWEVIVSKDYALWVQPVGAYNIGDGLFGTNGTLRYNITNS